MKQTKPLLLNGKPLNLRRRSPVIESLVKFLDKLPANELLTTQEILTKGIIGPTMLARSKGDVLTDYCRKLPSQKSHVFGSRKAIQQLDKLLQQ